MYHHQLEQLPSMTSTLSSNLHFKNNFSSSIWALQLLKYVGNYIEYLFHFYVKCTIHQPSQFHFIKARIWCEVMFYDLQCTWLEAEFWGLCVRSVHTRLCSLLKVLIITSKWYKQHGELKRENLGGLSLNFPILMKLT